MGVVSPAEARQGSESRHRLQLCPWLFLSVIVRRLAGRNSMKKIVAVMVFLAAFADGAAGQADPRSVVEAYIAAWNHHDFAAIDQLIASDGIHDDIANSVHAQGPSQVKDFMKSITAQEPDLKWLIDRVIVSGSTVVAEWTWTATLTGEGPYGSVKDQPISGRGASIVEVEEGRIKHFTDYYDTLSFFPRPAAKK
jgi:steroid delta-isomerase-like uncharacterized protein